MYSFTRSLIGEKLARMLIQVSVVVRTTSATDSPSTPSLYWMPKSGIQSTLLDELEEAAASPAGQKPTTRQERGDPGRRSAAAERRIAAGVAARDEGDDERPDERQEGDERSGSGGADVIASSPTAAITRYEPTMTISPIAMPRA